MEIESNRLKELTGRADKTDENGNVIGQNGSSNVKRLSVEEGLITKGRVSTTPVIAARMTTRNIAALEDVAEGSIEGDGT